MTAPGYEPLMEVLVAAFDQAAHGKGKERHADSKPFDEQPMQDLIRLYGPGFALGQAAKKSQESQRLPYERARAELLGAIVYTAGAIIAMDRAHQGAEARRLANDNRPPVACGGICDDCSNSGVCMAAGLCRAQVNREAARHG